MTYIELGGEITIEVNDVQGLNEYITDAVNEIVVDEVEKQMHSEFINNDEFQKSVKSAVIHHLDNDIKNHILSDTTFMNWMRTEVWKQVSEKAEVIRQRITENGHHTMHQTLRMGLLL